MAWAYWRRELVICHARARASIPDVIPGREPSERTGIQNSARRWIPGLRPRGGIPE
jgi:hypothetical protein